MGLAYDLGNIFVLASKQVAVEGVQLGQYRCIVGLVIILRQVDCGGLILPIIQPIGRDWCIGLIVVKSRQISGSSHARRAAIAQQGKTGENIISVASICSPGPIDLLGLTEICQQLAENAVGLRAIQREGR